MRRLPTRTFPAASLAVAASTAIFLGPISQLPAQGTSTPPGGRSDAPGGEASDFDPAELFAPGGPFGPGGQFGPREGDRGGPFGGRGFGGPGGSGGEQKLVGQFDRDGDGRLNAEERAAAKSARPAGRGGPGGGGFPGGRGNREPAQPGPHLEPTDVENYPNASLYESTVLRTLFLTFENDDWQAELAAFKNTDVEVPATVVVDGKTYPGVGVHFRGMSSYGMVPEGYKKSLNLSFDHVDPKQKLYGYKTLNLLNNNGDPSMLRAILTSHIAAEQGIPAPKANHGSRGHQRRIVGNLHERSAVQ